MGIMRVCLRECIHCNSLKIALDNCAGDTKLVERKHSMLSYNDCSTNAKVSHREKNKILGTHMCILCPCMCLCVCVFVNTDPL